MKKITNRQFNEAQKTQPQSRNEQIFQLVDLKRFWAINDIHSLSSIDFISFHKKKFSF